MSDNPIFKAIPLIAGSITITNFIISLLPIFFNSTGLFINAIGNIQLPLRFLFVIIASLIASNFFVKLAFWVDQKKNWSPSTKMTLISIFTVIFSWTVVFNLRIVAFQDNLSSSNNIALFLIGCWIFSFFSAVKLHYDYKFKLPTRADSIIGEKKLYTPFWFNERYFTPTYIRLIRIFTYYFVVIFGGFLLNFNSL